MDTVVANAWLYNILSSDTGLSSLVSSRIYRSFAPLGSKLPAVIFQHQGGQVVSVVGGIYVLSHLVYQVKAVGLASAYGTLAEIVEAIDGLLSGASGSTDDGDVLMCVRGETVEYAEVEGGTAYQHLGGMYDIYVQVGG